MSATVEARGAALEAIDRHVPQLVADRVASRITGAGELVTASAEHRDQHRNRGVATRRMERLLADALRVQRTRIPTRESTGAKLRRRASKQHHSQQKQSRGWRWRGDEE